MSQKILRYITCLESPINFNVMITPKLPEIDNVLVNVVVVVTTHIEQLE